MPIRAPIKFGPKKLWQGYRVDDLADRNMESWRSTIAFYESFDHKEMLQSVLTLVKQLAETDRARLFQAGHSVHNLVLSTADYWGLKDGDRRVMVMPLNPDFKQFRVVYGSGEETIESETCDAAHLRSVIEPMLNRLWLETRGRGSK